MFKIAEKAHRSSNPGWNTGSVPSSNPGSDPASNPGSNPGLDPGYILSLSPEQNSSKLKKTASLTISEIFTTQF